LNCSVYDIRGRAEKEALAGSKASRPRLYCNSIFYS
jgi:hypothetical protein